MSGGHAIKSLKNEILASLIPTEILCQIFSEAALPHDDIPIVPHIGAVYKPPGFGSLLLAGVCRRWRDIIMGQKQLWAHITVCWKTYNFERIAHYRRLAKDCDKTLVIRAYKLPALQGIENDLVDLFKHSTICRLVVLLHEATNRELHPLLEAIPPVRELFILRSLQSDYRPHVDLPASHCKSVKHLVIDGTGLGYETDVRLESFTLVSSYTSPHRNYLGHYIGGTSKETLQVLTVHTDRAARFRNETYPMLHTIRTNLNLFAHDFVPRYKAPQLCTFEIISPTSVPSLSWEAMKIDFDLQGIKNLVFHSMQLSDTSILSRIVDFIGLQTLELRGESVDDVLDFLGSRYKNNIPTFPCLERIMISSYRGTGGTLMAFSHALRSSTPPFARGSGVYIQVDPGNCTRIAPEVQLWLRTMS